MHPHCQSSAIAHNISIFIYHAATTPPPQSSLHPPPSQLYTADPLTVYGSQDDPGVVVRYDVSVAVFGLVDFQV